jgi:hypothetical protein
MPIPWEGKLVRSLIEKGNSMSNSRKLTHPVFGPLRRDREGGEDYPWWEGRARIPSLKGCRQRWAFDADLDGRFIGVVENAESTPAHAERDEFEIVIKDEAGEGPTAEQERAFTYLVDHGDAILEAALKDLARIAAEGYFDLVLERYSGPDADGFLEFVERLAESEGMREMVSLCKIDFCLTNEESQSLVALNFHVAHPLDDHGLAVVLWKDEVRGGGEIDQYDPE